VLDGCNSHISRIDSQLDGLQQLKQESLSSSPELHSASDEPYSEANGPNNSLDFNRAVVLQTAIKTFSTASSARAVLSALAILSTLEQAGFLESPRINHPGDKVDSAQEQELEWTVISKATVQTYGLILETLLDQTIPLGNDIGYWNEVLGSHQYLSLYTIQTSPLHLWAWGKEIYRDSRERLQLTYDAKNDKDNEAPSVSQQWRRFYGLVRDSIRDRSLADLQSKVL
jgi:nuclear control of ATPase protein 2